MLPLMMAKVAIGNNILQTITILRADTIVDAPRLPLRSPDHGRYAVLLSTLGPGASHNQRASLFDRYERDLSDHV